ncbi:MAG: ABC transporter [Deltaproteobacteria bacterium RIFOXYA12_FULL_58_15]|nr:MAG: ABC transporter [Deltaproteobacteria bacterium RIFOXYA12_FULL_58_15]OGR14021.1 MAG: ABC transporter [Deltaproteobacteria bacterium RIFOXYB12_FULL_58_9]
MVEARSLRKDYGATRAVDNISFKVSRGEIVGFLGPNGAGKTTTMKMITGFLKPTDGNTFVGDINVQLDPLAAQRRLGYLPESAPLYNDMMVADFVRFIAELRGVTDSKRLATICDRCGLGGVLGKDIGHLSKGFRQRVGLAQAMVHDPDLLILDEPTSGLDPNQIVEIRELIKELGREKTVILSTHILPEVQATCDRIIIVNDGRIVADDTTQHLTAAREGAVVRVVVKPKNGTDSARVRGIFSDLPGVRGVDPADGEGAGTFGFTLRAEGNRDPREAVFASAVTHDLIILDMHRESVSLEDTFRRLTRKEGPNA